MEETEQKKSSVVLYPSPGMGHLVSMFELAKLLTTHNLSATIVIVEPHYNTGGATAGFISRSSASNPSISFHVLPHPTPLPSNPSPHPEAHAFDLLRLSNPSLRRFLINSPPPSAVIIDFFCGFALDVTNELHIPTYYFFTSCVSALYIFHKLPEIHDTTTLSFPEMGTSPVHFPGIPPLPANHMPATVHDRGDAAYEGCIYLFRRFTEAKGFLINSFVDLEPRAVEAVSRSLLPPSYCIGPLVQPIDKDGRGSECLLWLDKQPEKSVVFLCFGSIGLFSAEQINEIAVGLEKSGQRFMWVVRSPPGDGPGNRMVTPPEPDLSKLLPEGFLERTEGRGLVVKSWAPQAAVLKHAAVGGFVTHCGWNSMLEAIVNGVPMIAWPMYAEQWMNKVFLEKEMKLAVAMEGYDAELVSAEEVERKVTWLMESEEGKELRVRTEKAKEKAVEAVAEGGKSKTALMEVVDKIKKKWCTLMFVSGFANMWILGV